MSYEMIRYNKKDAVATITLNRPEKYNTLRIEMIQEMDNALMDANQDDEIKIIVLEGAGDSFCGGFDFSGGLEHFEKISQEKEVSWTRFKSAPRMANTEQLSSLLRNLLTAFIDVLSISKMALI